MPPCGVPQGTCAADLYRHPQLDADIEAVKEIYSENAVAVRWVCSPAPPWVTRTWHCQSAQLWHPRALICAIFRHPAVLYPRHPAVAPLCRGIPGLCHPWGTRPQSGHSPRAIPVSGLHSPDTWGATYARPRPMSLPDLARWAPDGSSVTAPASPRPPTVPRVFAGSMGPLTMWTSTSM